MLTHPQIWAAIDALADRLGLTASGLAKRAGLDPTTFNRSKRSTPDGHLRWPSTESLAKVLAATGVSLDEFMALVAVPGARPVHAVPLLPLEAAARPGAFDERGHPVEAHWETFSFPSADDGPVFALEITGDDHAPFYRDGDTLIVAPAVEVRRGDRVVLKREGGGLEIGVLRRRTARSVEWAPLLSPSGPTTSADDTLWIARILWASQ